MNTQPFGQTLVLQVNADLRNKNFFQQVWDFHRPAKGRALTLKKKTLQDLPGNLSLSRTKPDNTTNKTVQVILR